MKFLISFFISILLINSCSEDNSTEPKLNQNYYIYYSLSQNKGWRPEHSGLYRFEYPKYSNIEKLNNYSIIHTTRVAKNGLMAYIIDSPELSLNIRFEDGNTQKVLLPEFNERNVELLLNPKPEISYNGNKLVFFIKVIPYNSKEEIDTEYYLNILNIQSLETELYNIKDFISKFNLQIPVKHTKPFGDNLIVNNDGSEINFVVKLFGIIDNNLVDIGYNVFQMKDKKLLSQSDIQKNELQIIAKIDENKTIVNVNDSIYQFTENSTLEAINLPINSIFSYRQFNDKFDKVALWDENGISLFNTESFVKLKTIITWDDIKSKYDDVLTAPTANISLSPDAEIVCFMLHPKGDLQSFHIFTVKSNGDDLKKILSFIPVNYPVISYGF